MTKTKKPLDEYLKIQHEGRAPAVGEQVVYESSRGTENTVIRVESVSFRQTTYRLIAYIVAAGIKFTLTVTDRPWDRAYAASRDRWSSPSIRKLTPDMKREILEANETRRLRAVIDEALKKAGLVELRAAAAALSKKTMKCEPDECVTCGYAPCMCDQQ